MHGLRRKVAALVLALCVLAATLCGQAGAVSNYHFSDIAGSVFLSDIEWGYQNGVICGYADGSFRPEAQITHQAFGAMILRACRNAGYKTPSTGDDLEDARTFLLEQAEKNGYLREIRSITNGTSWPYKAYREYAAAMLAAPLTGGSPDEDYVPFKDTTPRVQRMLDRVNGGVGRRDVIGGYADGNVGFVNPDGTLRTLSRGAAVAMIHRYYERLGQPYSNLPRSKYPVPAQSGKTIVIDVLDEDDEDVGDSNFRLSQDSWWSESFIVTAGKYSFGSGFTGVSAFYGKNEHDFLRMTAPNGQAVTMEVVLDRPASLSYNGRVVTLNSPREFAEWVDGLVGAYRTVETISTTGGKTAAELRTVLNTARWDDVETPRNLARYMVACGYGEVDIEGNRHIGNVYSYLVTGVDHHGAGGVLGIGTYKGEGEYWTAAGHGIVAMTASMPLTTVAEAATIIEERGGVSNPLPGPTPDPIPRPAPDPIPTPEPEPGNWHAEISASQNGRQLAIQVTGVPVSAVAEVSSVAPDGRNLGETASSVIQPGNVNLTLTLPAGADSIGAKNTVRLVRKTDGTDIVSPFTITVAAMTA